MIQVDVKVIVAEKIKQMSTGQLEQW